MLARRELRARGLLYKCRRDRCSRAPSFARRNLHARYEFLQAVTRPAETQRWVSAVGAHVVASPIWNTYFSRERVTIVRRCKYSRAHAVNS